MIADVVGYSRLMSVDEESTHLRLSNYMRDSIEPKIAEHGGRMIRSARDGLLVEFASAVGAVFGTAEPICLRRMRTSDDTSNPRDALN